MSPMIQRLDRTSFAERGFRIRIKRFQTYVHLGYESMSLQIRPRGIQIANSFVKARRKVSMTLFVSSTSEKVGNCRNEKSHLQVLLVTHCAPPSFG